MGNAPICSFVHVLDEPSGKDAPPEALLAIRLVTAAGPALFLLLAVAFAWRYGLGRTRNRHILEQLESRRAASPAKATAALPR